MATTAKPKSKRTTNKSALKRWRQSEKRRARNQAVKSLLRTLMKRVRSSKSKDEGTKNLHEAVSALHKAAHRGVLHRNNASRKVSRLSSFVNKLPVAA